MANSRTGIPLAFRSAKIALFSPSITLLAAETEADLFILRQYAEFWKIPYTIKREDASVLVFCSGRSSKNEEPDTPLILSPSGPESASSIAGDLALSVRKEKTRVELPVAPDVVASMQAELYRFMGDKLNPIIHTNGMPILSALSGREIYLLSIDIVNEYRSKVYGGLEDPPSRRFRLVSKLPHSYHLAPSTLRARSFKLKNGVLGMQPENLSPVECLRAVFLASLITVLREPIPRVRFWRKGKDHALAISHDVETLRGLDSGSARLLKVEQQLQVKSTWNVSSQRYPLSSRTLGRMAETGEVGAHDTKHDGRLLFLRSEEMVDRVRSCKTHLERLAGRNVKGFRAPLLQHSSGLLKAVGKAGYDYDSSIPSWEWLSPTSLRPHGIGTVFPLSLMDTLEIPISLPQDHQLVRVAGLSPEEAVNRLEATSSWVKGLGGACVLLVHPDYEFAEDKHIGQYVRLLEKYCEDSKCDVMTLGEMSEWWKKRQAFSWKIEDGTVNARPESRNEEFELRVVTGYGKDGFTEEGSDW